MLVPKSCRNNTPCCLDKPLFEQGGRGGTVPTYERCLHMNTWCFAVPVLSLPC